MFFLDVYSLRWRSLWVDASFTQRENLIEQISLLKFAFFKENSRYRNRNKEYFEHSYFETHTCSFFKDKIFFKGGVLRGCSWFPTNGANLLALKSKRTMWPTDPSSIHVHITSCTLEQNR